MEHPLGAVNAPCATGLTMAVWLYCKISHMALVRPNILHLFTDQQRWDTIRSLGALEMLTPTFHRLAAEGMAFTFA